ncbi:transglycosylase SLT domain-containing protein [Pacificoceanicola onchidii]|uniref:transglycosylase SLT domain-containing protein n=1 Tax=Pacificoceanicola onchidii TaxID=2562685 RepID=UPI0010A2C607|nr:transglycosylase SLT domain-containing protein [Pacificoceanicola onchidii]
MSKWLRALVIVLLAASCGGGGSGKAPRDLDNACSILKQRRGYLSAFKAAERKWGVPVHVQMATIYQESKFVSDARTPLRYKLGVIPVGRQSSAYGYSQALDGTWKEYLRDTGKRNARRDNIRDATDFMGWYMAQSRDQLGIPLSDARSHYLAYHEGRTGYRRGSYNGKAWLLRVSSEVGERSLVYQQQLRYCRGVR